MNNTHTIILNLERSKSRKNALISQLEQSGVSNYTFFPGFDGKDILNNSLSNIPILKGAGMGRNLMKNEIAVILSHIAALKHAKVMGYENVIILEDDVTICKDWEPRLQSLLNALPENWEYVYLSGHSDYVKIPMYDKPTIIPAPKMIGAFAYLVNKAGIDKLIKQCSEIVTTYDDMIMHKIYAKKLSGYLYLPFMVYHSGEESLIWDESPGHLAHNNNKHSSYNYFKENI